MFLSNSVLMNHVSAEVETASFEKQRGRQRVGEKIGQAASRQFCWFLEHPVLLCVAGAELAAHQAVLCYRYRQLTCSSAAPLDIVVVEGAADEAHDATGDDTDGTRISTCRVSWESQ